MALFYFYTNFNEYFRFFSADTDDGTGLISLNICIFSFLLVPCLLTFSHHYCFTILHDKLG